ncbi:diguanylate cyclase [Amphritea sp. HPY]|uniref:diguanylate cyclase n=1 Tax=Amphritea sp. HPY TaxID=3421652 RepID=UPI003D7D45BA
MLEDLLERIDQHEFEQLADSIKQSLAEHRKWMQVISVAIVSREPINTNAFIAEDAHKHCRFGKLMNRFLTDPIFHHGSFLKVDQLHVQLHDTARKLMNQLKGQGDVDIELYKNFLDIQKKFFDLVLMIFEFSVINKHQFDTTTKLMNRRTVDTVLSNEKHRMQRSVDSNCFIALADIDKFKLFNDTHGHAVGDLVLEHSASVFHESIRRHDTVARFGGEEFLFVLPDMNLLGAQQSVERIREKLANSTVDVDGKSLGVTASFGIAVLCKRSDIRDSIKNADMALYKAKENGRNCTFYADSTAILEVMSSNNIGTGNASTELIRELCYPV